MKRILAILLLISGAASAQTMKVKQKQILGLVDTVVSLRSGIHNQLTLGTANGLSLSTQVLSLGLASGSVNGALSSTDWTAFNSKFTLPSLTSGSVLFSNGTTIAHDNANFFWDNTNKRLGIGNSSPSEKLHITGNGLFSGKVGASRIISGIDNGTTRMSVSASALITGPMTLGSPASTTFGVLSLDGTYGCYMGINDYNGTTYIQSANAGGYSQAYPIVLQPSGGRVGIGNVASPGTALHINSTDDALVTLRSTASSGVAGFVFRENGNAETTFIKYGNSAASQFAGEFAMGTILNTQMTFYQGGTAAGNMRMIFDAAAGVRIPGWLRVGGPVGTTPGQTLDVNGIIRQSGATSTMLKSNSSGDIVAATSGTDYLAAGSAVLNQSVTTQTAAFKINGTGESTTILAAPTHKANVIQPYSGSTVTIDATTITASNMTGGSSAKAVVASSTGELTAGPVLSSGLYTPALTGSGTLSPRGFRYQRIGNIVSVDGLLSCTGLSAGTVTVTVTLPVSSNLTAAEDLTGTVSGVGLAASPNSALGDTGTDNALVSFAATGSTASAYVHFSYEIK